MEKFNVGDIVRFKNSLEAGKTYGGYTYYDSMRKNKKFRIMKSVRTKSYLVIEVDNPNYVTWYVDGMMIEKYHNFSIGDEVKIVKDAKILGVNKNRKYVVVNVNNENDFLDIINIKEDRVIRVSISEVRRFNNV